MSFLRFLIKILKQVFKIISYFKLFFMTCFVLLWCSTVTFILEIIFYTIKNYFF
jgi:hypothetical protein